METRKSFVGLEEAYSFFRGHSSQLAQTINAIIPIAEGWTFSRKDVRICFSGCGDIEIALQLVESLKARYKIHVTLVDAHSGWLHDATQKLRASCAEDVSAFASFQETGGPFDITVAYHTMYYVPDLHETLRTIRGRLAQEGILIAALASRSNKLKQCAADLFKLRNERLPYWQEEDLIAALSATGFSHEIVSGIDPV